MQERLGSYLRWFLRLNNNLYYMKKFVFIFFSIVFSFMLFNANAQDSKKESLVNNGIYIKETIPQRLPIPYPPLREADMMWTKRVWRFLNLQEKLNLPLYYPILQLQDRMSLVQRLFDAIKYNEISAYDPDADASEFLGEFTTLLSYDQVLKRFNAKDTVKVIPNPITGRDTIIPQPGEFRWKDVKEIALVEEWFFDKQHSTMQVRIIGLCPLYVYFETIGDEGEEATAQIRRQPLFWVYFPEIRKILANTPVYNNFNDAQRISFDDIFFKRRFSSYIFRESNVYDNRMIMEYSMGGVYNMLESDRIKNELFTLEHDLWEY